MAFFGELYLRSTLPFLSEERTEEEVSYLLQRLGARPEEWVADLGCGHGRHASLLGAKGLRVVGLELDALSLAERRPHFSAVRGDLRALPFRKASLGAAYAWYSSLFVFDDAQNAEVLGAVADALRPGGTLILHTVPFERLASSPTAVFETTLPDGTRLSERSQFDATTGRDEGFRQLELATRRVLSASYIIRYYRLPDLTALLDGAGLSVRWVHGGTDGAPLTAQSTELIVGAERRHG